VNRSVAALITRGTLAANRFRLALTVACIALGVALAGAVHTIHASALAEIDRSARALAGAADLEIRGPRSGFDDAVFIAVANRPEVLAASPIVEIQAALAGSGGGSLRVLGIDAFRAVRLQPAFVARASATGMGEVSVLLDLRNAFLSPQAAARHKLRVGDTFRLVSGSADIELRVAGVLPAMNASGELAVIDIAAAQAHFDRIGRLSRIDVRLRPGVDTARLRASLAQELPAGVFVSDPASLSGRAAAITRAYRVNLDALALVALATGAFLVFSTLALQAARRQQEFALLRALGVTRSGLAALLALEGAAIGLLGAILGTALGVAASRALLAGAGADLGAGYFSGEGASFAPDVAALGAIALVGIAMSVGGALWVARAVGRIQVADALRDRAIDLPVASGSAGLALLCVIAGVPFLFMPAVAGLPLGGYAAIASWLLASVLAVGPLCRALLSRWTAPGGPPWSPAWGGPPWSPAWGSPVASLALAQVRHLPGHLAASVAGIVVSASLCVAMAIMVFSFRVSLEDWLAGVVGADLYVRSSDAGESGYFSAAQQESVARLAEVASSEPLRFDRLAMSAQDAAPLTLIARPITPRILEGFQSEPPGLPRANGEIPVWISEAARDLHGWKAGDRITLPIAGRPVAARVAGVIRDYARTWGAVMMPLEEYRKLTGDARANDLAIHLEPGTDPQRAEAAIRGALPQARAIVFENSLNLRQRSLEIFDRSFAVTYALEAIAIAIGLAGVTSSFAALAWSRRREFGVLRFLGLTRHEILRLLAFEGAAAGALGALIGLASGIAISIVLVRVVNRQSFHWSLEMHWPIAALAILVAAIVTMCAIGARVSGAMAVRREAILAVKDDA
jgi:putative ABC transport system permease protein